VRPAANISLHDLYVQVGARRARRERWARALCFLLLGGLAFMVWAVYVQGLRPYW
jgi:hypothetical protein